MKKQRIVILLGVFILLLACYFGIASWNQSKEEKEDGEKEAKSVKVKTLSDITQISYTYNEEDFSFVKQDGQWIYAKDEHFPLEQSYVETMEDAFGEILAERELKGGDELADYGLDQPQYTIRLQNEAGEETAIYIGNSVNDSYYMTVGDQSKVYTVSSTFLGPIQYDLMSLLSNDAFPYMMSGHLEEVVMTKKDKTKAFVKEENESPEEDETNAEDEKEETPESEDAISILESAIGGVTLSDCADYYMEETEAATYGMDEKNVTKVDVTYSDSDEKEKEFTFYIGATDPEGENRYVKLGDSNIIYKVDRTKFQEMDTLFDQ